MGERTIQIIIMEVILANLKDLIVEGKNTEAIAKLDNMLGELKKQYA